jgi:outer membrane protein OmpA-like peptidoglycan-associated protein/tetratricopeptide (TPR) repeat protein
MIKLFHQDSSKFKNMKIKLVILAFLTVTLVNAQKAQVSSADKKFENLAYIDAISIYEDVAKKGYKSTDLFQKLGDANYFNANLKDANKWYTELFALNQKVEAEYYYRYSQTLKSVGDYTKADQYLKLFSEANEADVRAKLFKDNQNYLAELKKASSRYEIEDSGINSKFSDYGAAKINGKFVFTSTRDTGGVSNVKHKWTNQSFSNLFDADVDSEGYLKNPQSLAKKINSKFNESSAVYTKDGKTMYFTRNNYINGKKQKDGKNVTLLKLYKATFEDSKWGRVEELPFNSNQYSCAHPALSPDDSILYFASDMPGTIGLSDIFKVTINKNGSFGVPQNLGTTINTESRETFPFISDENELIFASDGQLGFGGLDVFSVKIYDDGTYSKVFNVGEPVNSTQDDFAYFIESKSKMGYFTSNRDGGKGQDDIYKLKEITPLKYKCATNLTGVIVNQETSLPQNNAKVTLFNSEMKEVGSQFTNEQGVYSFSDLECEKAYSIRVESKDFEVMEQRVVTSSTSGDKLIRDFNISSKYKKIDVGSDLTKNIPLKPIYFDTDKSNIRPDAEKELIIVLSVMNGFPNMKLAIKTHTDSRATSDYNIKLSERRAVSIMKWLIKNGISKNRLTAKGYGETQLTNNCSDGIECSEDEHQANRRSEFIILQK